MVRPDPLTRSACTETMRELVIQFSSPPTTPETKTELLITALSTINSTLAQTVVRLCLARLCNGGNIILLTVPAVACEFQISIAPSSLGCPPASMRANAKWTAFLVDLPGRLPTLLCPPSHRTTPNRYLPASPRWLATHDTGVNKTHSSMVLTLSSSHTLGCLSIHSLPVFGTVCRLSLYHPAASITTDKMKE